MLTYKYDQTISKKSIEEKTKELIILIDFIISADEVIFYDNLTNILKIINDFNNDITMNVMSTIIHKFIIDYTNDDIGYASMCLLLKPLKEDMK